MSFARIIYGNELPTMPIESLVRINGKILNFDVSMNILMFQSGSTSFPVDTTLLGPFPHNKGELHQIVGRVIQMEDGRIAVRATILKNVADLDMKLFDLALKKRRELIGC